jgi:hypothetical protein
MAEDSCPRFARVLGGVGSVRGFRLGLHQELANRLEQQARCVRLFLRMLLEIAEHASPFKPRHAHRAPGGVRDAHRCSVLDRPSQQTPG